MGLEALSGSLWVKIFQLHGFTTTGRQREDLQFADVLHRIKTGQMTQKDHEFLKENTNIDNIPSDVCTYTM